MAISGITKTMSQQNDDIIDEQHVHVHVHEEHEHEHEQDMVMPGFRFHPTEEELIEFYLRRKVEGKRFNVELITFLDLYRYDPWELPALAAIGEKEWFFYVPRDRKYRNGDRPNRVTTSGYWKATGADRMIRTENSRSIGLKKTLVFYSGKAPKGIRTSWIMNEYRLPHHETERLQKAEISLCRVYKRAGVEDHPSLPRSLPTTRASSSSTTSSSSRAALKRNIDYDDSLNQNEKQQVLIGGASGSSNTDHHHVGKSLALSKHINVVSYNVSSLAPIPLHIPSLDDQQQQQQHKLKQPIFPISPPSPSFVSSSSSSSHVIDDLHRLVNFQNVSSSNNQFQHFSHQLPPMQPQLHLHQHQQQHQHQHPLPPMLPGTLQPAFSDRLWDWNSVTDPNKDFHNPFK